MKRKIFSFLIIFTFLSVSFGQETEKQEKEKDKPVRAPWSSGILIDQQTSFIPYVRTFESVIQHRFGSIKSDFSDLFGIYSPGANLRMGFNYVILKNVQIGYGLTKGQMYNDFNIKWTVFEQTRKNKMPISITLFSNFAISGNSDNAYGDDYQFGNRVSAFSQLIIGRKVTDALSLQTAASFTHYNWVDTGKDHDILAWHLGGKLKFSSQSSLIFNFDLPLEVKIISEQREFINHPKANLSIGYEVSTGMHAFQFFIATSTGIVPQDIIANNHNDWTNGEFSFGFTMNRIWGF
ncbi:MAG: DUF5777 family beta-barrel protein [Bacteroidales bacterium]|jgi:hypothetical protein|nr:DUF5777 family beta-barrel protein [Bacteroidales bacterium]